MVVANGTVDLVALKARHPLGDAVEAAGVRLRGRGRVRQGVCPFHDEVEGSFTVYSTRSGTTASAVVTAATCWTSSSASRA